ncbi:hypothetical protein H0H81_007987 [Sphagnurus paluster]|uniref:Uncharacterized protein n=1 Tax=Sphagnurus paluster TaxID=117069 RepID=A0A9P7KCL5_9AGAR|nr:hypothetical protein H0H81_007987 [Sphagnurus paluster]
MLSSKACDVTGIVAIACARHGCFAPNSLTNLTHGERQVNIDWALLKALETTNMQGIKQMMIIYDIVCQYFIKLRERIGEYLPMELAIEKAIGLMHVHGHQLDCFFRYAPSFIPGAGVVAGEILESLWANLNAISPSTRTATLAHRAEILDDHMNDSNFKKLLSMSDALCVRLRKALTMRDTSTEYFRKLAAGISEEDKVLWEIAIEAAEHSRIHDCKVMDIMKASITDIKNAQGESGNMTELRAGASTHDDISPEEGYIILGIQIEEKQ